MKNLAIFLGCAGLLFCGGLAFADDVRPVQIRIVYPPDKMTLPAQEKTYVFGSVSPPDAQIFINGLDSPLVRSSLGSWLAIIPIQPGKFPIIARAVLNTGEETSDIHRINVPKGGSPVSAKEKKSPAPVDLGDQAVHTPPAERVWKPHRIGRLVEDTVFLRSGPNAGDEQAGFELPLQKNVLVTIVGQIDKQLHVRLSDLESVWVDAYAVKLLPNKTPAPEGFVNAWTVRREFRSTILSTTMQELLPYRVTPSFDGRMLTLKIYGGISNTDWIHFASDDPWIRQARWSHPIHGVYQLDVELKRPVWGYDIRYEKRKLILELRDPPDPPPAPADQPSSFRRKFLESPPPPNPLENVTVCLDPGHPPLGATGPSGVAEHAVNWLLAGKLRDRLMELGATVVMTRNDNETLPLPARVVRARAANADLFVSIHTNGLPPDANPFEKNGFSVYFFQPFGLPLAEAVHAAFREQIPLRDDGLHYGNLHVVRQSYMPSVLVECAYLIWPPEEELLLSADFQIRCAGAIASGIETFLKARLRE